MQQSLEWIESGGGPLLIAPRSALVNWHGSSSVTSSDLTDYRRACAVTDEIDAIPIGTMEALVLGDEPDRTTFLAISPTNLLVLRWRWARSEESLLSAINLEEIDQLPPGTLKVFEAVADQYLLFDSAYAGTEIVYALQVELEAGPFSFDTLHFRPDAETCMLIHRLRKVV